MMTPVVGPNLKPVPDCIGQGSAFDAPELFQPSTCKDWSLLETKTAKATDVATIASCYCVAGRFLAEEGKWVLAHTAFQASAECWLRCLNMLSYSRDLKPPGSLKEAVVCLERQREFVGLDQWLSSSEVEPIVHAAMGLEKVQWLHFGNALLWLARSKGQIRATRALQKVESMCEDVLRAWLNLHGADENVTTSLGCLYLAQGLLSHPLLHPGDGEGAWEKVQLSFQLPVDTVFALDRDYTVYKAYRNANDFEGALPLIESVLQRCSGAPDKSPLTQAVHRVELAECLLYQPNPDLERVEAELNSALKYAEAYPFSDHRLAMAYYVSAESLLLTNDLAGAKGQLKVAKQYVEKFPKVPKAFAENGEMLEARVAYAEYFEARREKHFSKALEAIERVVTFADGWQGYSSGLRIKHHLELASLLLDLEPNDWLRFDRELEIVYEGLAKTGIKCSVLGAAHLVRAWGQLGRGNISEVRKWFMQVKEYEMLHEREFAPYENVVNKLEEVLLKIECRI